MVSGRKHMLLRTDVKNLIPTTEVFGPTEVSVASVCDRGIGARY